MDPYAFYRSPRPCPSCGGGLVSMTPLSRQFTQGILSELGFSCQCVGCSTRYRARNRIRFPWIAWAGPAGRWLWWKTASFEVTLRAESP